MRKAFILYLFMFSFLVIPGIRGTIHNAEASGENPSDTSKVKEFDSLTFEKIYLIDSFMQSLHQKGHFNGQILVSEKGKIIYNKSMGYSNFSTRDSLNTHSLFQLASVSKPITSTALLMLVQDGKLNLDDKVEKFFPKFPYQGVTVKHLLQHTSGIPEYYFALAQYWDQKKYIYNKDVLNLFIAKKPKRLFPPGTRYSYCNSNYCLLSLIIEEVSGKAYDDFLSERIFKPAGMKNTIVFNPQKDDTVLCKTVCGYTKYGSKYAQYKSDYRNGVVGDKGIFSTAEDLFKFDLALNNKLLLNDSTLELAYTMGQLNSGKSIEYALGWRIRELEGNPAILHYGFWNSFRTGFVRFPETQSTIIVFNNVTGAGKSGINNRPVILKNVCNIINSPKSGAKTDSPEEEVNETYEGN